MEEDVLDQQIQMGSHKYWIVTFDNKTERGAEFRVPGADEEEAIAEARRSAASVIDGLEQFDEAARAIWRLTFSLIPVKSCVKATGRNFYTWPEAPE